MLTAIREGSKGWISAIIIGAIVLTFALFGISSYLEGGAETPAAVVNGEEIDSYAFQNQVAQQRQTMLSRFGGNIDPAFLDSLGIREQVLNSMIDTELVKQYTSKQNYRLSDQQLSEAIISNPMFLTDGKFDSELYQRAIASNGLSPQGYEAIERQNRVTEQLNKAITDSAFTINSETSRLVSLQTQERIAQYAILSADTYVDEFEITDEEANAHYTANIDSYQNPARMKIEYIDLNLEEMAAGIEPDEEEITQTFERLKGQLTTPEVRKASHILFNVKSDADEAIREEINKKALGVLDEINAGADFSELAKQYSDDPGSARNGGDLGIVARGQMVQPFEEAVYAMSQDEVVGPVQTQFGLHLIKLTEFTPQRQKTLEEAREELTTEASRALAEAAFADLIEPLESLVFEQPDSLVAAADETGMPIQQSEWFTEAQGDGVAAEAAVRRAAFAPDVKDEGLNGPIVDLGFERMVALRKLEFEAQSAKTFDEVRDDIIAELKLSKSAEKLAVEAPKKLEGLTHMASWDIMLAKNELENEALPPVRSEISPALANLAEAVYKAKAPASGPFYNQTELSNGDIALFALKSVSNGKVEAEDDPALVQVKQQLTTRDGANIFRQFVGHLRSEAEVVIAQDQL